MKKVVIILIVLALVGGGAYYFFTREKEPAIVCEPGFRLDFGTRTCIPVTNGDTVTEIDFSKTDILIPESSIKVKVEKSTDSSKYSAEFTDPDNSSIRGSVFIDASKMTRISEEYVLAPLFVTYGGTGQFVYIALLNSKSGQHVGSVFVGDRIEIDSIKEHNGGIKTVDNYIIKIQYKTRLESEPFSATASIPAQLVVEVRDDSIVQIMRLQNADYGDVEIKSPLSNSNISGDFAIKGSMSGSWYFEASAQFRIMDSTYKEIAIGSVQALSDWMTTQRVPFEVKMNTSMLSSKGAATIIISSENVEGGEEGERRVKKMEIPVVIK